MESLGILDSMKHSPMHNYGGIPGLTSWLLGAPSPRGLIRLMENSRHHQEPIIPHSHRFSFHCKVLNGNVRNIIWTPASEKTAADWFEESELVYQGEPGKYLKKPVGRDRWAMQEKFYRKGDEYGMSSDQVHSIFFSRGAQVLFFEGPQETASSIILEPVVEGVLIPTFQVPDWAFSKGQP